MNEGDAITIPDDDDIVEIKEDDDNDVSNNDHSSIQSNTNIIPIPDDGLTSDLFQLDEIKYMYCGKVFKRNSNKHFHEKHCISSNKQPLEISESITQTGKR